MAEDRYEVATNFRWITGAMPNVLMVLDQLPAMKEANDRAGLVLREDRIVIVWPGEQTDEA